eukprot:CAMPEP_0168348452 /NCGR_PEP_ID=MMETSP0213-20121227/19752_1 /TAXON_ID=151035 /ORGANISM="Euplotes harpa, Strain FSP1.4" /LENGTH=150 /DNA_ID=CAMNT_0008358051 /DNA_START=106 /DNA_END=558 /DNA_ORIENTATION=-
MNSGFIFGIDFGVAFDNGIHLGIPELIPFRLTSQIQELIEPYSMKGYMKHALYALRRNQNLILDTCDIFIKEPLIEWIKEAQNQSEEDNSFSKQGGVEIDDQDKMALCLQKIKRVKDKLKGKNSAHIMMRELADSIHYKKDYFPQLKSAL